MMRRYTMPFMPRAPFTLLLLGIGALPARAQPHGIQITSVSLSQPSVIGGATVTVIVTLSENAGPGVSLKLLSGNTAIATVPQSVVAVQPGTRTGSFVVQTKPVAANPNVATDPPFVEISAGGSVSSGPPNSPPRPLVTKTARLIVLPAALASLTLSPSSVSGGTPSTAEVRLTGPASAGGVTIALASSLTGGDPAPRPISPGGLRGPVVSVPAQVTVPAGASSTTFQVTTRRVTAATPAQVTAAYGAFNTKSATLTITP